MTAHKRQAAVAAIALACTACSMAQTAAPASALNPIGSICGVAGLFSGIAGKACKVLQGGQKLLGGGKKALGGGKKVLGVGVGGGAGGGLSLGGGTVAHAVGLAAVGAWVLVGAKVALNETAKILDRTTSPQLGTTWFSSTYWRMAGIAAVLTLPFLFAATVQALMRSDLALLARAALVYLPVAMLAVSIAAPLTMLLLAASDQMSAIMASAAGNAGTRFLTRAGTLIGGLAVIAGAPFIAFVLGLFTVAGAVVLWLELLMREAAVYVVVLMLPLAFSAFVWPARRVWAIRAVELLAALILSKFAIVAVLALGAAALGQSRFSGVTGMMAGTVLVTMGAFAPWALLRLLPLAELASGAAGSLRGEGSRIGRAADSADAFATGVWDAATRAARSADESVDVDPDGEPARAARAQTERLAELTAVPVPGGGEPGTEEGEAGGGGGSPPGDGGGAGPGSGGSPSGRGGGKPPGGDSGPTGSSGAPSGPPISGNRTGSGDSAPPPERLPGLGPLFQMDNYSWRPLTLGPGEDWPAPPLAPAEDIAGAPQNSSADGAGGPNAGAGGTNAGAGGTSAGLEGATADDPDPRPAPQAPEDGRL